ncbi:unnamed protein product [Cunninghamella echinulata]
MSHTKIPVDTYYYDILDIPTNADYLTVKRFYKTLALKYHPDKNKSTEAEKKFKEVLEAYQILADDNLKLQYDNYGRDNIEVKEGLVDARVQFQNMYGGNSFRSVFGQLNVPIFLSEDDKYYNNGEYPPCMKDIDLQRNKMISLEEQQQEKVNELAQHLKDNFLKLYHPSPSSSSNNNNDYNNEKLIQQIQSQCKQLKHAPYGNSFLLIVGQMYILQAKRYLGIHGKGWPSLVYGFKDKKHNTKELWKSVKITMETHKAGELLREAEKKKLDNIQELDDIYTTLCYRSLFQMVKFEVQATIRCVCQKLLNDQSAKPDELNRRANGLLLIGNIYVSNSDISEMENNIVLLLDK